MLKIKKKEPISLNPHIPNCTLFKIEVIQSLLTPFFIFLSQ